jgi:signal transduction histidine kinase
VRDRLLVAFVSLTVTVVAVFLVERAYTTSAFMEQNEQLALEGTADVVAGLLDAQPGRITRDVLEQAVSAGDSAIFVAGSGRRLEVGEPLGSEEPVLTAAREVGNDGRLVLLRDVDVVDGRVADALLPLALTGIGVVAAAILVALWLARRFSRPFADLAVAAGRIGLGDFDVAVPRSSVPEADAVARALTTSAKDLDLMVRRERDFAAHASHELRTPITALRLELEDLMLSPRTPPGVVDRLTDALGQLDRLSLTVADLLDSSRQSRIGSQVAIDLTSLVKDTVARWRERSGGRSIVESYDASAAVRMPAGALLKVVDALIGNAVRHGEGAIAVSISQEMAYVEIRVADEGPREAAERGAKARAAAKDGALVVAGEIAEALGGRLRLCEEDRTTFSVVLPRHDVETLAS